MNVASPHSRGTKELRNRIRGDGREAHVALGALDTSNNVAFLGAGRETLHHSERVDMPTVLVPGHPGTVIRTEETFSLCYRTKEI